MRRVGATAAYQALTPDLQPQVPAAAAAAPAATYVATNRYRVLRDTAAFEAAIAARAAEAEKQARRPSRPMPLCRR